MNSITEKNSIEYKINFTKNLNNKILNLLSDKVIFQKNFTHVKFIILHEKTWEV